MTVDPTRGNAGENKAERCEFDEKRWYSYFEKQKDLVAVFTMVAAFAAAIIYGVQSSIFSQQLEVAKDQERRQLQAYVGLHEDKGTSIVDFQPDTGKFNFILENFGETPAYKPSLCLDIVPADSDVAAQQSATEFLKLCLAGTTAEMLIPGMAELPLSTYSTIWPKEIRPYQGNLGLPGEAALNQAIGGQSHAYLIGVIQYSDVFGSKHHSYLCYRFVPDGNTVNACSSVALRDD